MQPETTRSNVTSIRRRINVTHGPTHPDYQNTPWLYSDVFIRINASCESLRGQQPHFSVTVDGRDFGGCCHDLVLNLRPDLKPVVDLHLSTDDGVPMHAVANAVHWISGILTDLPGFKYRPNNSKHDYDRQTPAWCLRVLGEHLRMDPAPVVERVREAVKPWLATYSEHEADAKHIEQLVHDVVSQIVDEQRPRWKTEADQALRLLTRIPESP